MHSEKQMNFNKPPLLASNELYKFCEEFDLIIELEKPFQELDGLIIKVKDSSNNLIKQSTVENMSEFEKVSGTMLNKLSQNYPK
jgi:hypothetical protein